MKKDYVLLAIVVVAIMTLVGFGTSYTVAQEKQNQLIDLLEYCEAKASTNCKQAQDATWDEIDRCVINQSLYCLYGNLTELKK